MNAELTPQLRGQAKGLLDSGARLQLLACERPGPHDPYDVAQYCYYRVKGPPGILDLQFGLSARGQLAFVNGQVE